MEELLSLKWNNHRSTFLHILGVLRDKQAYTDVTLACDGKFYSVHKLVLSTCSDYFCAMFDKTACKSPVIVLKDIKSEDLEALLDYMYLGEVNVRQSDLASLIKAAENLRIKGLAVPDDEPPKKGPIGTARSDSIRRDGGSGSPPAKRKRREEVEDGRDDVRPPPALQSGLHTPPPPTVRPKSPVSQRLSPSPIRTSHETHIPDDRDSRPLSSSVESPVASHVPHHQSSQQLPHQSSQSSLQSSQQLTEQEVSNQYRGEDTPAFVKVEMEDEDAEDMNRDSYNVSGDGYKEENSGADLSGDLSNDLPEFLQQAASGALAGTSASYHHAFAGPSGFQPDVSGWQGDSQSLPGSFSGLGFQPSSQENPPGIGAELLGNVCKVCGKVFNGRNWKQNLKYHMLTHTKFKPFKCPICPHSSALKYNLIRHIRNRHYDLLTPALQNQSSERDNSKEIQMRAVPSNQMPSYSGSEFLADHIRSISSSQEALTSFILDHRLSNQGAQTLQNFVTQPPLSSNNNVNVPPIQEVCSSQNNVTAVVGDGKDLVSVNQELNLPPSMGLATSHNQESNLSHNSEMSSSVSQQMNMHTIPNESNMLNQDQQALPSCEMQMLSNQDLQMPID